MTILKSLRIAVMFYTITLLAIGQLDKPDANRQSNKVDINETVITLDYDEKIN